MNYKDTKSKLNTNAYITIFFKANGDLRCMLCTRNYAMAASITGFISIAIESRDNKHTESTGGIAVIDLEKKDIRAFKIDRAITMIDMGDIRKQKDYEEALKRLEEIRERYAENMAEINFDSL